MKKEVYKLSPQEFYGIAESEQFVFYRVPKALFTEKRYACIPAEAKLLYGFLLDRMGLSVKNGWTNEDGLVFIYYTVKEAAENLGCGLEKAGKRFAELEKAKLIFRKKQGQGKPAKIFIRKFVSGSGKSDVRKSEVRTSRQPDSQRADIPASDGNKTDRNHTELNDTNPSINDRMDVMVKKQIEYEILINKLPHDKAKVDEIVCLIADVLSVPKGTIRISGSDLPAEVVHSRFRKLTCEHIEYVIDSLNKNTTEVRNIRAYLLTALYSAPATMDSYYTALVNHDLYGI